MKLTKQDYQSALEIWPEWDKFYMDYPSFDAYCQAKIIELEKQKLKKPMYRCIKLPHANGMFKIGNLYTENYCIVGFSLSELPFHFELVEPEPEPEKITWEELVTLIQDIGVSCGYLAPDSVCSKLIQLCNRIKTDHL